MAPHKTCPKCAGRMEEGFAVDATYGENNILSWHRGAPEKKWWGLKLNKKEMLPIHSWRCHRCGYLENYAT